MSRDWSSVGKVPEEDVTGMVQHLQSDWRVASVERSEYGTDLVAMLDVDSPDRRRRVVLKATTADWVGPETARAEPRLLSLVARETDIPVPSLFGVCERHSEYPAPFFLMEYVDGTNHEDRWPPLRVRERVLREAGRNLAAIHELDVLAGTRVGRVGVQDGTLGVLETDEFSPGTAFHDWLLSACEESLDSLADGGYFPELAADRTRFADIVPELRAYLRDTLPDLPEPEPPVLCHSDYRYGNLLVDPETGETRAVLDWGLLSAAAPAYNLAKTESFLLSPDRDGPEVIARLRERFRSAYTGRRDGWTFDELTRERMRLYRLTCRIDAMSCLPLWHEDASPAEREQVADRHRAFVAEYL